MKNDLILDIDDQIYDMSVSRNQAINQCISKGRQFIEHFKKILKDSSQETIKHHATEMQAFLDDVKDLTLKPKTKIITYNQLFDWFFTKGSSVEVLFKGDTKGEALYNKFLQNISGNYNVETSLKSIGLLK